MESCRITADEIMISSLQPSNLLIIGSIKALIITDSSDDSLASIDQKISGFLFRLLQFLAPDWVLFPLSLER